MTPLALLLTLAAAAATPAPQPRPAGPARERIAMPRAAGRPSLEVRPLEGAVVLGTRRGAAALARALRASPPALCPEVEEEPGQVVLRCRSHFIDAQLQPLRAGLLLELAELPGLPATGPGAPIFVPFDLTGFTPGGSCEGGTALARADCALSRRDLRAARAALEVPLDALHRDAADLRLGEIALAEGDPAGAALFWKTVRPGPWQRLAAVRLCELSRACLEASGWEEAYDPSGLPPQLALDLTLRHARALAFTGRPVAAAALLFAGRLPGAPLAEAGALRRRLVSVALRTPGPEGAEALALWLALPDRSARPDAWRDLLAAASQAEALGAPVFASSILSAGTGLVPDQALPGYLARTAELYLATGDRIRAGVVVEFARNRLGERGLGGERWRAIARAVKARGAGAP